MYLFYRVLRITYFVFYVYFEVLFRKNYALLVSKIEAMGPAFIKFGQFFSSMGDCVGCDLSAELKKLCDNVGHTEFRIIRSSIEKELSRKVDELFVWIKEKPVASASIAQVHEAMMLSGKVVAVKVLKPNVEKIFKRDIRIAFLVVYILSFFLPKGLKVVSILRRFANSSRFELDLKMEAASLSEMRSKLFSDKTVVIPEVYWDLTSRRVLTTSWLDGVPLTHFNHRDPQFARRLIKAFFKQVYVDGFFHGDMHPGNIFCISGHKVGLVDFGIVGRIDKKTKMYLLELLKGFLERDYEHIAELHYSAGYVKRSHTNFASACRALGEPIVGKALKDISLSSLLGDFFKLSRSFQVEVNPNIVLIQKNLIFLEANCLKIDPEMNMWLMIEPMIRRWYKEKMHPLVVAREKLSDVMLVLKGALENHEERRYTPSLKGEVFFWIWIASIVNFLFILAFRFI